MQTKEMIMKSLIHDLKNPLYSGKLVVNKMKDQYTQNKSFELGDIMHIEFFIQICLTQIFDHFDLCQYQMGTLRLVIDEFDLNDSIMQICNLFKFQAISKGIQMDIRLSNNVTKCNNDERRMQQVVTNLINNALKFTKSGGKILIETQFVGQNLFFIRVRDSGVGMSPEILSKICKLNATFNNNNLNSYGTGIGLHTCKNIISIIGPHDDLFIHSKLKKGSEFSFLMYQNANIQQIKEEIQKFQNQRQILSFLQISIQSFQSQSFLSSSSLPSQDRMVQPISQSFVKKNTSLENRDSCTQKQRINVLIIDDDIFQRQAMIEMASKFSFIKIMQAENGKIGLEKYFKNNKYKSEDNIHIIFTDIDMPIMDGYQMSEQIINLSETQQYQRPIIIAQSSEESQEFDQKCRYLKIDQNYRKPIIFSAFKKIIENYKKVFLLTKSKDNDEHTKLNQSNFIKIQFI